MPSTIRVLDDNAVNKIKAGEVIENPSSVVKELVENSIDAGATEISVEIRSGGRQLIRVTDNGRGMNQDDALLSLERHATSKIRGEEDIHSIGTMGFRGEAIPSIASISKFTMLTCPQEATSAETGTMVLVEGGKILRCSPAACSPGTTIEVKSLFFNVPVRRKFQKSPAYDANEIQKMLTKLALGNPDIRFELIHNDKKVLTSNFPIEGSSLEKLGARIDSVLGNEYFESLCPMEMTQGNYGIRGYIGQPIFTRQNRTGQFILINQRSILSPFVGYAIREGYGTTLSPTRHPVFVLHMSIPPENVDVNVHPQKKEVRLRNEDLIRKMIVQGVEDALQGSGIPLFSPEPTAEGIPSCSQVPWETPSSFFSEKPNFFDLKIDEDFPATSPREWPEQETQQRPLPFAIPVTSPQSPAPKVVAAVKGYILVEGEGLEPPGNPSKDTLFLVDQRSAHSRVIFEKLVKKAENQSCQESQSLLIPVLFETTPLEANLLRENLDSLNKLGIHIREFGNSSFAVDAVPHALEKGDLQEILSDLVQEIREGTSNSATGELEKKIAKAATKSAMSSSKRLEPEEAQSLITQLVRCELPWICPWGKPTAIPFKPEDLASLFRPSTSQNR